jgi:carbohydrate kinase (thermoresistant glucokinase family)
MKNLVLVVMGVSGSGKTTVAKGLAERLHWPFQEGDSLHPPANVEKMAAGIPLTDEDRWPWLALVAKWIDDRLAKDEPGIITCSMLKRAYRDKVIRGKPGVRLLFLQGDRSVIAGRMAKRKGHYMPTTLLDSQLATLEVPGPDEDPLLVPIDGTIEQMVDSAEQVVRQA